MAHADRHVEHLRLHYSFFLGKQYQKRRPGDPFQDSAKKEVAGRYIEDSNHNTSPERDPT